MPSREEKPFVIAVIGGGIGGLFAVLSLHHHCATHRNIAIHVYEQAAQYKEIGAGIGIGVNAARLLHKLGLGEATNNIAGNRNGVWISFRRWDNGEDIVTVPVDDNKPIRQLPVQRSEFLDLLVNAVKERDAATLHTNKRCRKLVEKGDEVLIEFADGTDATANLVVGCDGIHSAVRSQFIADNPMYSGRIAFRGLVPIRELESFWPLPTYSASWLGKDKHCLMFPISQNKTLNIVAFVATEKADLGDLKESWTATGSRAEVMKHFEGFEETVKRTLSLMGPHPSKWLLNDRDPLEQWVWLGGKVVLMGDAAHAMLPHQGAGAGQAIEDGYILGRAIQDFILSSTTSSKDDLKQWTQAYQSVRLPRAQKAQKTARQAGQVYEMQTEDMMGKSFDECVPRMRDHLKDRMQWIWTEDIDIAYEGVAKDVRAK